MSGHTQSPWVGGSGNDNDNDDDDIVVVVLRGIASILSKQIAHISHIHGSHSLLLLSVVLICHDTPPLSILKTHVSGPFVVLLRTLYRYYSTLSLLGSPYLLGRIKALDS